MYSFGGSLGVGIFSSAISMFMIKITLSFVNLFVSLLVVVEGAFQIWFQ